MRLSKIIEKNVFDLLIFGSYTNKELTREDLTFFRLRKEECSTGLVGLLETYGDSGMDHSMPGVSPRDWGSFTRILLYWDRRRV